MRLALDVSTNQTFNTVQPLMNFWAAFTPSNEVRAVVSSRVILELNVPEPEWCGCGWEAKRVSSAFELSICRYSIFTLISTVYGLYRDGTELRGVYYTDADKARAACSSLGDKCDFPILMGKQCHLILMHCS